MAHKNKGLLYILLDTCIIFYVSSLLLLQLNSILANSISFCLHLLIIDLSIIPWFQTILFCFKLLLGCYQWRV